MEPSEMTGAQGPGNRSGASAGEWPADAPERFDPPTDAPPIASPQQLVEAVRAARQDLVDRIARGGPESLVQKWREELARIEEAGRVLGMAAGDGCWPTDASRSFDPPTKERPSRQHPGAHQSPERAHPVSGDSQPRRTEAGPGCFALLAWCVLIGVLAGVCVFGVVRNGYFGVGPDRDSSGAYRGQVAFVEGFQVCIAAILVSLFVSVLARTARSRERRAANRKAGQIVFVIGAAMIFMGYALVLGLAVPQADVFGDIFIGPGCFVAIVGLVMWIFGVGPFTPQAR